MMIIDAEFKKLYKKLNKAQKEAVDSIEGPVMVIAGPGTGKTTILALRIANILQKTDTPASGILALTFTDAGVKAMRSKLRESIGGRADEVRIHTFHGFASSIIHEFPDHFPRLSLARELSDIESESFIRNILEQKKFSALRPFGAPDLYVRAILQTISNAKKEALTPEMVASFALEEVQRIQNDESAISTRGSSKGKLKAEAEKRIEKCEKTILFSEVYEIYEDTKKEQRRMDFDDLIFEVIIAFRHDELLLRLVQEKFLYVLIDEHQDTNDSQNVLVGLLADFFDNPNVFIVGDEKQAIYRFQGASVANFLRFEKIWKDIKIISLSQNYRSHQSILDASFGMIEKNYDSKELAHLRIKLKSATGKISKPIEVITAGNEEAQNAHLVESLKKYKKTSPSDTVAIIVRTNRDVENILRVLESNDVSASAERGADIFSHPAGALFFNLLDFVADPSAIESFARTLAGGLWDVPFEDQALLIKEIRSGSIKNLKQKIPKLEDLQREHVHMGPIQYLVYVAEVSGFTDLIRNSPEAVEVWRGIVALAESLAHSRDLQNAHSLISELLLYKKSAESRSIKIPTGSLSAKISVLTAHSSKGLEYDSVYIPYATEESWMSRQRSNFFLLPQERGQGDEERDARRLFYVALTRAKKHISIITPLLEGGARLLTSLRFIDELAEDHISRTDIPAQNFEIKKSPVSKKQQNTHLFEYAKRTLGEKGLSVTALNHFMNCPTTFFYKSIMKLPETPNGNSEKGNAMHEAFSRIWHLKDRSEKTITDTIQSSVKSYFKYSLLPLFEKEIALKELIKNAPIVAKALREHFSLDGIISTETWAEHTYNFSAGREKIPLSLHGKLDVLVETKNAVYVFDYKTREGMSLASIKGETKDSDGGYFRQLIFYKLLLRGQQKYKGKEIIPALVFIKPDNKGRCPIVTVSIEDEDLKRVRGEVQGLVEGVWKGNLFNSHCDDPKCEYCNLRIPK